MKLDAKTGADLIAKIRNVKVLILDVDGVLTDGRIIMSDDGQETKCFNVRDGHGLKLIQRAGIDVIFLTGRKVQGCGAPCPRARH